MHKYSVHIPVSLSFEPWVLVWAWALFLWIHLKYGCAKALLWNQVRAAAFARESLSCLACDASEDCDQRTFVWVTEAEKWYTGGISSHFWENGKSKMQKTELAFER